MSSYGDTRLKNVSGLLFPVLQKHPMENALEVKKARILKRLETTIKSVDSILYEINQDLEDIIANNRVLVDTADIYDLWIAKE